VKAWRARQCSGSARPPAAAHILSVVRLGPANNFVDVTFDTTVTAISVGDGLFRMTELAEDSTIDSQPGPTVVRYGSYDPIGLPQHWAMIDATGLTFAGGVALAAPLTGSVS